MEPLLKERISKQVDGQQINIRFTKKGNSHLFSDTFGRTRNVSKDDLKELNRYLKHAEFIESSGLTHPRNDDIERFYYFKVQINGNWVRFNVAKEVRKQNNGKKQISYFLYSINDIK